MDDARQPDPAAELERRRREARRAVEEAGGGESEGFELAEQELIDHASHGDFQSAHAILHDEVPLRELVDLDYGEADEEHKPD